MSAVAALNTAQAPLPVWNVDIDGKAATLIPTKLQIKQSQAEHENAQLTCHMPTMDYSIYIDKPISFQWGPNQSTFTGTVRQTTNSLDNQSQPYLTLDCMGPTWQMGGGKPKFYSNTTAPDLVAQICRDSGLGCVADPHPYIWQKLVQTTESDWAFINELALCIGYFLTSIDGVIRLMDPIAALDNQKPSANLTKSFNILDSQPLLDFTPQKVGPADRSIAPPKLSYMKEDKTAGFVNPDSQIFSTDYYIPNTARADLLTKVTRNNMGSWVNYATARVKGNTTLHPGLVMNVITGGSDVLTNESDGLWFVYQTIHIIDANTYQTQMGLARDVSRFNTLNSTTFWGGPNHTQPQLTRVNDRWVSSWR